MSGPKIEVKNLADLILVASIVMFFLGVTGGIDILDMKVAAGQEDSPFIIGGLLLMTWVGLRFFPPKS